MRVLEDGFEAQTSAAPVSETSSRELSASPAGQAFACVYTSSSVGADGHRRRFPKMAEKGAEAATSPVPATEECASREGLLRLTLRFVSMAALFMSALGLLVLLWMSLPREFPPRAAPAVLCRRHAQSSFSSWGCCEAASSALDEDAQREVFSLFPNSFRDLQRLKDPQVLRRLCAAVALYRQQHPFALAALLSAVYLLYQAFPLFTMPFTGRACALLLLRKARTPPFHGVYRQLAATVQGPPPRSL